MPDELLPYYERELTFVRQMSAEFSEKHPGIAAALKLEPNGCEDPHVERMIESFALLAGRIHHKLDDEFPEITEALLEVLYPHYLRPIPSQGIVQFQFDTSQSAVAAPPIVPVGTPVHTRPDDGEICSFRTCYPASLSPLRVRSARVTPTNRSASPGIPADVAAVLSIHLECPPGIQVRQLSISSLRFYLHGEKALVQSLYELLFLNTLRISLRSLPAREGPAVTLPINSLRQVGFGENDGILPYSGRSFLGYRLLQEYFSFPEKFLFVDLTGLECLAHADFENAFEVLITLKDQGNIHRLLALEQSVNANTFQLNCTPVVNLFERPAEPIRLTQTQPEYRIIPDQHRQSSTEIFSVDQVTSTASYHEEPKAFQPFYSVRHSRDGSDQPFWYAHRRPSRRQNDNGTEMYLSVVDMNFTPALPATEMLTVRVTCTNRDQVSHCKFSGEFGELETEGQALVKTRFLRKPTATMRPPLRRGLQWRLISQLSLNHLSIVDGGREALQEILRLYDIADDLANSKRVSGITNVASKPCVSRVQSTTGVAFCRGTEVTLHLDENEYDGGSVFLFASVLQRFLCLYSAINSFTRVSVRTSKGVLKQWPAIAGEQILL